MSDDTTPQIQLAALFTGTDGPRRHAAYAELAATGPVHHVALPTGGPAWLITGYGEAPGRPARPAAGQERCGADRHVE